MKPRRSRAPRFLWLAASRPKALPLYVESDPTPDNDNARPVKALSLDVERWMTRFSRAERELWESQARG
jgi:hypothetical protein